MQNFKPSISWVLCERRLWTTKARGCILSWVCKILFLPLYFPIKLSSLFTSLLKVFSANVKIDWQMLIKQTNIKTDFPFLEKKFLKSSLSPENPEILKQWGKYLPHVDQVGLKCNLARHKLSQFIYNLQSLKPSRYVFSDEMSKLLKSAISCSTSPEA